MKSILAIALFSLGVGLSAGVASAAETNEVDDSAKALAEQVCNVCHGRGGHGANPAIPNLDAQPRAYLAAKLRLFRNRASSGPQGHLGVLGLSLLDDPATEAIARYYALQPRPQAAGGGAAAIAAGEKIFVRGIPEQNVPACTVCHGVDGAGRWIFPRLAGQHAAYLQRQMKRIQFDAQEAPVMHGVLRTVTPDEINALAAYAQSK